MMNRSYRLLSVLLVIGLMVISLPGCVSSQRDMIASSDEDKDSGLGGTGMVAVSDEDQDGGIGGTGIMGVITGFGSIFVNGIEIEYDETTVFSIDGKLLIGDSSESEQRSLQIGDVVEVLTVDSKQHTHATRMNLRHEVIGKVESVDAASFSFTVNGQSIVQAVNNVSMPEAGQVIAVSGFRIDGDTILATRITAAKGATELLRRHVQLPFAEKVTRWRVQTFVRDRKAAFYMNDAKRVVTVDAHEKNTLAERLGIKVLQLQRSATDQLQLQDVLRQSEMPRGRQKPAGATSPPGQGLQESGVNNNGMNSSGMNNNGAGPRMPDTGGRLLDQGAGQIGGPVRGSIGDSRPGIRQMQSGRGKR